MNFLLRLLITAAVAYGLTHLLDGVQIANFTSALIFAFVLALLNMLLKPLLVVLTIPITVFTLGLFLFVINACIILIAAHFLDGFSVDGFWWALLFSILLSIVSSAAVNLLKDKD